VVKFEVGMLKSEEIKQAGDLLFSSNFYDYSMYKSINKDRLREYLFNQIYGLQKDKNSWIVAARKGEKIVGFASLSHLLWDTGHFGFKMGKISHLVAGGPYKQAAAIKDKLLGCLFQLSKKEKIVHLSCRTDAGDTSSMHALERNQFRLMDTLVTYAFNKHKYKFSEIKDLYRVRGFKKEDMRSLVHIAAHAFTRDRFHLDPFIPVFKANSLFGEWIKNCCKDKILHKVLVAQDNKGCPVGFLAYQLNGQLEKVTGAKIIGRGLSAVLQRGRGAYVSLVKATINNTIRSYDYAEFDTQINNLEVIKVWGRFRFDFIGAKCTFHKSFGG
jgi:hypothetical protein